MGYSDKAHADAHFAMKLNTECWDNADVADQNIALNQATLILDRLCYAGSVSVEGQANEFPRNGDTVVPNDIMIANDEIAFALLDGVDPEVEFANTKVLSQGYSSVRSTYDRQNAPAHVIAGIPSVTAWHYIMPYLNDSRLIDLQRV